MKAAVVYCSQTGFTKKYAEWLADELGCKAVPFAKRSQVHLGDIDVLVFCSWFHAAQIKGSKWLKKVMAERPQLRCVLLATGATPMPEGEQSEEQAMIDEAFDRSFPKDEYPALARFYCHGGFDFDRLGAPDKVMMRMFFRMHEKNAGDPKVKEMLDTMRQGFDATNRAYLEPVLRHIRMLGA